MAAIKTTLSFSFIFLLCFFQVFKAKEISADNLSATNTYDFVVKRALDFINNTLVAGGEIYYKDELLGRDKLDKSSYVIDRLIFKLEQPCDETNKDCFGKACMVDLRQTKNGDIDILEHSFQCTKLYPDWNYDEIRHKLENMLEQKIVDNLEARLDDKEKPLVEKVFANDVANEKSFVAVTAGPSKYCPGCPYQLNVNSLNLEPFAELAMQSIDKSDVSDYKYKLIGIVSFSQAVPFSLSNAIQYELLIQVGETMCKKSIFIERSECTLQPNLPIKICRVKFLRQYNTDDSQVISNNCTEFHNDNQDHVKEILNSSIEDDTTKSKFTDQVAQEAQQLSRIPSKESSIPLNRESGTEKFRQFDKYLEEFFVDPSYTSDPNKDKLSPRRKRDTRLGGFRSIDTKDPEVTKIIHHGLKTYSKDFSNDYKLEVFSVKRAQYQIVAGKKYLIDVDIGFKTCKDQMNCETVETKECTIEAISQPWLPKEENLSVNVNCNKRSKRSLRGVNYSQKMLHMLELTKEERLFGEFIETYNKIYESEEEKQKRFQIFKENLDIIEELQRNEQGTAAYNVNQFADLTKEEFKNKYLGLRVDLSNDNNIPLQQAKIPNIKLPNEFDWRHYNVVTPVKNQGQCGSCWAFSVTGNIESQYAIKHSHLYSLSEQELLDCDKLDEACNGGLPDLAYRAIEQIGGLETESDYPYDARREKCSFKKNKVKVTIASAVNITSNETQIAQWLVKNGPVSIGINANAMQFYVGGISHPYKFLCSPGNLDHGVLIVGYGIKNYPIFKKKLPYWIIKNSWGPRWGEQGYYRVYRGDGTCGVNKMVTSAIVN